MMALGLFMIAPCSRCIGQTNGRSCSITSLTTGAPTCAKASTSRLIFARACALGIRRGPDAVAGRRSTLYQSAQAFDGIKTVSFLSSFGSGPSKSCNTVPVRSAVSQAMSRRLPACALPCAKPPTASHCGR